MVRLVEYSLLYGGIGKIEGVLICVTNLPLDICMYFALGWKVDTAMSKRTIRSTANCACMHAVLFLWHQLC